MDFPKSIKKRVSEDTLVIDGRTFKTKKFDPLLGNYILLKLFTMTLPFGIGEAIKSTIGKGTEKIPIDTSKNEQMSKADFLELQRDILSFASELLPSGEAPVVRENGTYGIQDFTMSIALQLIIAVVAFNFSDFFEDVLSKDESTAG